MIQRHRLKNIAFSKRIHLAFPRYTPRVGPTIKLGVMPFDVKCQKCSSGILKDDDTLAVRCGPENTGVQTS
jgi:hypothetical protein